MTVISVPSSQVEDLAAYRAETERLVAWHLEQLHFAPRDMERRRQQTEAAQLARWGKTGLDLLSIPEDEEERLHRGAWTEADVDDVLSLIDAL